MLWRRMQPWSLHPTSTMEAPMRTAGWLWATALILSAPAAAIEPDVTGSISQSGPFADAEFGRSPRFPSISPELLEMLSERVLPTALGPYTVVQARRVEANASLVFCSHHNHSAALLSRTGRKDRPLDVNAIYVLRRDSKAVVMSDMDPSADRPWTLEAVQQLGSWRARVFLCR